MLRLVILVLSTVEALDVLDAPQLSKTGWRSASMTGGWAGSNSGFMGSPRRSQTDSRSTVVDDRQGGWLLDGLVGLRAVDAVARTHCVVSDAPGNELLAGVNVAVLLQLVLVDVARGDELVADPKAGIRTLRGRPEHHHVVERRIQLGERAVRLLAEVLDPDAGVEAGHAVAREVELGCGGDEPVQAHLGGNRHCLAPAVVRSL